ncbi:VCBS repeat-containing protein [uncultured Sulfitobacter sp.]|uniref:FG-GAP repeat domain-containing protein n=1 Tax=uncultured Sulfitobacter sp. TaxID=191468 RepID=UPI0026057B5F|nr:VCBS repeat-containing protein [uncultured Sulfitobacter sp.]
MRKAARRLLWCGWPCATRRARLALGFVAAVSGTAATAETITSARFAEPTTRYAHGVLGDYEEWGALVIETRDPDNSSVAQDAVLRKKSYRIRLPLTSVFEDVAPRLADVDGDGKPEIVVVESDVDRGASLAIYTEKGKLIATPYIGQRNRWLAPIAIADMDSDGHVELAYIDRPHLAKTLRIWRFQNGALSQVAHLAGLTNHRIGERDIAGGLRDCGKGPEMIVARSDWQRLMAVTFNGTSLRARDIARHKDRSSFAAALACK